MHAKTNFYGLRAGTVFSARNKLGETQCYRFQGIDLDELKDGCVGCRYIMLQSMADETDIFGVEAAWFAQRKITVEGEGPEVCNGYAVIESASVAGTEIVICKPVAGNKKCSYPYVVWLRGQIGNLCCGEKFDYLDAAQWHLREKVDAMMKNFPFIVKVVRVKDNTRADAEPLVVASSTKEGYWPTVWMEASIFPMREDQKEGYFICTKGQRNELRVHKEVRRKECSVNGR